jgi:hypothetical protein
MSGCSDYQCKVNATHKWLKRRLWPPELSWRLSWNSWFRGSIVLGAEDGIHQRPKSGISFGSRNAAIISRRWRTGPPLSRHCENKTRSSRERVDAEPLSSRIGNRAWRALMRRNRSLPFIPGISKSRIARSKVERSQRNACLGQLTNTTA